MAKDTEHFSKYLLAACISPLEDGQFISLAQFLTRWFVCFCILLRSSSSVTDINIIFGVELVQFLPLCRRTLPSVDFAPLMWGRFSICWFHLPVLVSLWAVGLLFRNHIPKWHLETVHLPCFRICIYCDVVSTLSWLSLELELCIFSFLMSIQLPQHFLLKMLSFF